MTEKYNIAVDRMKDKDEKLKDAIK